MSAMLDRQMTMWKDGQEELWQAVMARDSRFDGTFVFAVSSTKIYCRPSCPSRRPHRGRVSYFRLPEAAEQAGFRACRRCHPKRARSVDPQIEMVQRACRYIELQDETSITLADLGEQVGVSPFHLQRVFKKVMGITPRQYADARRIEKFKSRVREGGSVTGAMYDAGFSSSSRLYARAPAELGMTPATYGRGGRGAIINYTITPCSLGMLLVAATERGVCAVKLGDSHASLAADLTKEYPSAEIHRADSTLSEPNYRSTQTILDVAGAVVKNKVERKGKKLWTSNPAGERVRYYQAFDADAEARFVASKIVEQRREQYDLRAAVLYRTNSQSRVFEEAMRRAGLAYNIVGGFSFYERMEVRDIIAYLKLALNPHDSIALARVINSPPRGIGKQTLEEIDRRARDTGLSHWETISLVIEKPENLSARAISALRNFRRIILRLGEMAGSAQNPTSNVQSQADDEIKVRETGLLAEDARNTVQDGGISESPLPSLSLSSSSPVSDIVKTAILETGYENALKSENTDEAEARLENLQELVNAAVDYDEQGIEGLREFIDHSALVSDADQYKRDAPVTLMTAHSAKGLEFPLVFIVGLEDGLFPHSRSATDPAELEEERRLCYVAMTRAEQYLYVTHAMKRRVYGEELASEPSQFLNEMPLELLEDLSLGKSWLSFARGSSTIEYEQGEYRKERKKFSGKTYDSVDSIAEFFNQRNQQLGRPASGSRHASAANRRPGSGAHSPASGSRPSNPDTQSTPPSEFVPGSYVRHAKYGRGLVLHREGAGDSLKLTVTFPGYGQKKLVQKYAGLEKA